MSRQGQCSPQLLLTLTQPRRPVRMSSLTLLQVRVCCFVGVPLHPCHVTTQQAVMMPNSAQLTHPCDCTRNVPFGKFTWEHLFGCAHLDCG